MTVLDTASIQQVVKENVFENIAEYSVIIFCMVGDIHIDLSPKLVKISTPCSYACSLLITKQTHAFCWLYFHSCHYSI